MGWQARGLGSCGQVWAVEGLMLSTSQGSTEQARGPGSRQAKCTATTGAKGQGRPGVSGSRSTNRTPGAGAPRGPTWTTFGWLRLEEMAASITAIFSRFSAPLMLEGRIMVFTATTVPRHRPLYTWVGGWSGVGWGCGWFHLVRRLGRVCWVWLGSVRLALWAGSVKKSAERDVRPHLAESPLPKQIDGLDRLHVLGAGVVIDRQLAPHRLDPVCWDAVGFRWVSDGVIWLAAASGPAPPPCLPSAPPTPRSPSVRPSRELMDPSGDDDESPPPPSLPLRSNTAGPRWPPSTASRLYCRTSSASRRSFSS